MPVPVSGIVPEGQGGGGPSVPAAPPLELDGVKSTPAVPRERRDRSGDIGVAIILGGTNVVIALTDRHGNIREATDGKQTFKDGKVSVKLTWDELKRTLGKQTIEADSFSTVLRDQILDLVVAAGVNPQAIRRVLISYAGPVTDAGRVTATNSDVRLDNFPITTELLAALKTPRAVDDLPMRVSKVVVINDGRAGALGEVYSPLGSLQGGSGSYFIWGTGVGGAAVIQTSSGNRLESEGRPLVKTSREFTEFGHALIQLPDGSFKCLTVSEMVEQRYMVNSHFQTPPPGETFLEHLIGGPWVVDRYIKLTKERGVYDAFRRHASSEGRDFGEVADRVLELSPATLAERSREVPSDFALWVSRMLCSPSELATTDLQAVIGEFQYSLANTVGKALFALGQRVDGPIVLGSSMAEVRADDEVFVANLRRSAGSVGSRIVFSQIPTGLQREAAAIAWGPRLTH